MMRYLLTRLIFRHQLKPTTKVMTSNIGVISVKHALSVATLIVAVLSVAGLPGQALAVFMEETILVTVCQGLVGVELHSVLGHVW